MHWNDADLLYCEAYRSLQEPSRSGTRQSILQHRLGVVPIAALERSNDVRCTDADFPVVKIDATERANDVLLTNENLSGERGVSTYVSAEQMRTCMMNGASDRSLVMDSCGIV